MPRAKPKSLVDIFYNFVRDNPKVAAGLAFELGLLAGNATKSLPWRRLKNVSPEFVSAMPHRLSQAALKMIAASPNLQPQASRRPRKSAKRSSQHKAEKTNGQKSQRHHDGNG